jgi:predicted extracellular nuclease
LLYGILLAMSGDAHVSGAAASSLSASNLGACGDNNHPDYQSISAIQGSGFASPLLKYWLVIEGVVTLSLMKNLLVASLFIMMASLLNLDKLSGY